MVVVFIVIVSNGRRHCRNVVVGFYATSIPERGSGIGMIMINSHSNWEGIEAGSPRVGLSYSFISFLDSEPGCVSR